jgi:hypothetical protein
MRRMKHFKKEDPRNPFSILADLRRRQEKIKRQDLEKRIIHRTITPVQMISQKAQEAENWEHRMAISTHAVPGWREFYTAFFPQRMPFPELLK